MKNLIKKVQGEANNYNLWQTGSKVVLGVSGGPDSVCLLDILAKIKEKYGLNLHIAHVNYCLRGNDSEEDEKFVQKLAEKYQINLSVLKAGRLKKNESSEDNLRNIRYSFFRKIREELEFDSVAVAHNQDDQAETYLMRVIRGAGMLGLSAMKHRSGEIIRPLLGISRKEIMKYLKENNLKYRIDQTNKKDLFFRNKVRNKLIPYLEKNFNSNIKKTIFDSTLSIEEDLSLISELSSRAFEEMKDFRASEVLKLHPALQKRLILREIEKKKGDLKNIESVHVEEILKIIKSQKSKIQTFCFQGLKLTRKGDKLDLFRLY